jgi:hypothetical protein
MGVATEGPLVKWKCTTQRQPTIDKTAASVLVGPRQQVPHPEPFSCPTPQRRRHCILSRRRLRSQNRPLIGRGNREVDRVRGVHTYKPMHASPAVIDRNPRAGAEQNSAALGRFPSIQSAEFESNFALAGTHLLVGCVRLAKDPQFLGQGFNTLRANLDGPTLADRQRPPGMHEDVSDGNKPTQPGQLFVP